MMKLGIDASLLDQLQQRLQIALHMGLTRLHRERLVDDRAERHLVEEAAVHARYG